MASRGLRKTHFFFHLQACERRNFDLCVFLRMCSLTKYLQIVFSRLNSYTTHPQEHTKIKVSPLTGLQMEKKMLFGIPEMPSKTFVMLDKKLPDHFNNNIHRGLSIHIWWWERGIFSPYIMQPLCV